MSELPRRIEILDIPQGLVAESSTLLEPCRTKRVEGCILWYGHVTGSDVCTVKEVLRPAQENRSRSYAIPAGSIRAVQHQVRPHDLLLLMQLHTHPREAFFSEWDAENALNKRPGALNMILPDYGNVAWLDRRRICVVELDDRGRWIPWTLSDWPRIRVIPNARNAA